MYVRLKCVLYETWHPPKKQKPKQDYVEESITSFPLNLDF